MSSLSDNYGTNDRCEIGEDRSELFKEIYMETPKTNKRKRASASSKTYDDLTDYSESSSKKRKQMDLGNDFKAKQEKKMKFINSFVEITMKYSEFLEKKIEKKGSSAHILATKDESSKKASMDITNHLKYFEGGNLHPYQVEGVTWLTILFENSVNGILADEMGLGKTVQVIALLCHLYERKVKGPYLIVAPLSTLGNWEAEFKRFAPQIPIVRLQGSASERQEQSTKIQSNFVLGNTKIKPIVLCSYQTPLLEENFLKQFCWTYIIVDEGHRIKNPDSRLSKELRALRSENRLLLTGTPLQNDIKELWALFNFLMPELFEDIEGFSSLIELEDMKDRDKILGDETQMKIISTIHKVLSPFMLRREKKSVFGNMVPKKEVIIYCPLTELQKYIYRATLQKDIDKLRMRKPIKDLTNSQRRTRRAPKIDYSRFSEQDSVNKGKTIDFDIEDVLPLKERLKKEAIPSKYTYKENVPVSCPDTPYICRLTMQNITMMLKKAANHPYLIWCPLDPNAKEQLYVSEDLIKHSGKLMVLDTLLPKLKAGGHKVLIFTTLVMFMDMIEEHLCLRGYNFRRLDGSSTLKDRNESIEDFMTNPDVFLFLLSTRAGGLGLNLTAADTVIFMDRDWNPMADLQAQDRCHRIGQTKPVMIYSLIAKNTIDEVITKRGDMKKLLEKLVIKEGKFKTLYRNLNDDELKELEDLLNREEQSTKIYANGLLYTDQEINKILDRTELLEKM